MVGSSPNRRGVAMIAVVGAIAGVLYLMPAAALADDCSGGSSAVNIYSECIPTASGGTHQHAQPKTTPTTTQTWTTPAPPPAPPVKVTKNVHKTLAHAGHDKMLLRRLATDRNLGANPSVEAASFRTKSPSAVGAVFDLGSGPTALFSFLAGAAFVLLSVGSRRLWRQRQN